VRVPPGRAGRLWLLRRLEVARRGTEVLEQKRQTLMRERLRTASALAAAAAVWDEHGRAAAEWSARALALAGARRLRLAAQNGAGTTRAHVVWRNALGTVVPDTIRVEFAAEKTALAAGGGAGVALCAEAHRSAVVAAAALAAAHAADEAVAAELVATTRRLRAIERRWIPDHESALRQLEITLAEHELEDAVRSRFALERQRRASSRAG
jgi:V/A-type H+-transporting ATPase subunit D